MQKFSIVSVNLQVLITENGVHPPKKNLLLKKEEN